jgi:hypothetical protein
MKLAATISEAFSVIMIDDARPVLAENILSEIPIFVTWPSNSMLLQWIAG